jgi:nitrile hydratase
MGGMTCYGPVEREENESLFHAPWEKRVFAMTMLSLGGIGNLDEFRHAIERMDPVHYLSSSYYEHWLAGLETLAIEKGLLTPEEIASGALQGQAGTSEKPSPLPPEVVATVVRRGAPATRDTGRLTPRFTSGDHVVARTINPTGHTRMPRYVRGKTGVIDRVHGTFLYPDTNAHGGDESPQPLYSVCFEAQTLWGPDTPSRDSLYIDLWEDHLEAV